MVRETAKVRKRGKKMLFFLCSLSGLYFVPAGGWRSKTMGAASPVYDFDFSPLHYDSLRLANKYYIANNYGKVSPLFKLIFTFLIALDIL
jgi:hypothetical protein